jgi:prolyl-tRNA synthetase
MTSPTTTASHGAVHRWRNVLIPTAREAPADAETISHILLHRAGFVRPVGAGIYDYLPLAWRTIHKISAIIRSELDAAGACEMLMPALEPFELFKDTKRDVDYGDNLFRLTDRKGRTCALAPTHEEVITELLRACITSYKQLPLNVYQIQTKFRDEARPRAGLLRCREFLMKDAYSFHDRIDGPGGLNEAYDAMYRVYTNSFTRCGLDFTAVEAESGPIGGSASHEFMVNAPSGEDTILRCPVSGYAANVEKCEIGERAWSWSSGGGGSGGAELKKHHTPNMPGIDAVAGHLKVTPAQMLKTIVFKVTGRTSSNTADPKTAPTWILAVVRGDHDVNEGKVKAASGYTVILAPEAEAKKAGFAIGYVSPRVILNPILNEGGLCKALVLVDPDAVGGGGPWATGADEHDHHVTGFDWTRDLGPALKDESKLRVTDVRNALEGDPSPRAAGARLVTGRGIEVGHIFKLGTKYSSAMGLTVLDDKQQRIPVIMGCYGIGVSRTMAAAVEQNHDENGIVWPSAIAPYHVLLVMMKPDDNAQKSHAADLSRALAEAGLDVLIDDRDERPGVKFKDADLIGIPIRLTLGDKALAEGSAEFKLRKDAGKGELVKLGDVVAKCVEASR